LSWDNSRRLPAERARARVLIVYVGGTVGMRRLDESNPASPLANVGAGQLAEEIQNFGVEERIAWTMLGLCDPEGRQVPPVDSSEVGPTHWLWIAQMLERHYGDFDGFVILHGTDTLAYTASALSFLCVNLAKPVVMTGSQLPIFTLRSDARQNLLHALLVAGARAVGLPIIPEVTVCFANVLLRGNRARKASTSGWQGFASPNYPALGSLGERIRIHTDLLLPMPAADAAFYVGRALQDQVLDLTLFPGIQPSQLRALLRQPELRGLVLRAYGSGNAPEDPALLDCLGQAVNDGLTILVVTQCSEGRVDLGRYASSRGLLQRQLASGFDLTPEAALTKLMWVLANEKGAEIRAQLQQEQRGEQSFVRHEVRFEAGGEPRELWELNGRAAGAVSRRGLEAAMLRLQVEGSEDLRVELNERDILQLPGAQGGSVTDVTDGVRRYMVDDRPFHLRIRAERPFRLGLAELLLTAKAGV